MKKILFLNILLIITNSVLADRKSDIYNCYIRQDMHKWKQIIDKMEAQTTKSDDFLFELLNYEYGYISWCITNNHKDWAEKYVELGEKHIEYLERKKVNISNVLAYKSAFYGFEIGISPYKAPFLGYSSLNFAKKAIELAPNNAFAHIQYASAMYHIPEFMGGSKTIALTSYIKAKKQMEKNLKKNDWNYIYLLVRIAKTYTDLEDYKAAKTYYEKILKIEPEFLLVKNRLYPQLLKLM